MLNINRRIYGEKGMRRHGNAQDRAYVGRKEADATGERNKRNGQ